MKLEFKVPRLGRAMYILFLESRPVAKATRWQRLCMEMAEKSADEQAAMHIEVGTSHKNVKVLR